MTWQDPYFVLSTAPTSEPVTVSAAKAHLRVDHSDEDTLIASYITQAREYVETVTGRPLMPQTHLWKGDAFEAFPRDTHQPEAIIVPKAPLASVTSIVYQDAAGASQTWSSSLYVVSTPTEQPGRITPAFGESYPSTRNEPDAVTMTLVTGYANAASVPQRAKQAILLLTANAFEIREPVVLGTISKEVELSVDALLWSLRLVEVV